MIYFLDENKEQVNKATETALLAPPEITQGAQQLHAMRCAEFHKAAKRRAIVDNLSIVVSVLLILTLVKQLGK